MFLILSLGLFYWNKGLVDNPLFLITNYLILVISLIGMFYKSEQFYSLGKFFFLFSFFFFGIIPYLDFHDSRYYWGGEKIEDFYFIITNVIIILSLITYYLGYLLSRVNVNLEVNMIRNNYYQGLAQRKKIIVTTIILVLLIFAIYGILYRSHFSFFQMLFRGVVLDELPINDAVAYGQIMWLFLNYFITPMPVILLFIYSYFFYDRHENNIKIVFIVLILSTFIFVAPTSVARFLAISLYLAILLRFTSFLKKRFIFQLGTIFGLLIILPFLDKFRNFDSRNFDFAINFGFLSHGHFDAYQNFVRLISLDITTYGNQLVGSLLFFIPRSIFEGKANGSGALLAEMGNLEWNNISFPFLAEGYINFSIFGTIIFAFILGYLSGFLDKFYWSLKKFTNNHWYFGFYYLAFGLSFFILRGDLMSSYAYSVSILGSYLLTFFIILNLSKVTLGKK